MNDKISAKDKQDWENFLSKKEKLKNKDIFLSEVYSKKVRSIDLHGYSLEQANQKITNFINKSYLDGVKKLIIVTGKGLHSQNDTNPYVSKDLSILKYSVPEYIKNNKNLMNKIKDFGDATIYHGGAGAFYIYLKKKNNTDIT